MLLFIAAANAQLPAAAQGAPLSLSAPRERATGVAIRLAGRGAGPGADVGLQRLTARGWLTIKGATADAAGRVLIAYLPQRSNRRPVLRLASEEAFASVPAIAAGVRAARRRAHVVVATSHWGIERSTVENARQRAFARAALAAGATAVIGAHPHVLQPIRRPGAWRLIAYSLGNFVWAAGSSVTSRTGTLRLRLSGRGVEGARLLPGRIVATRPRLICVASG